MQILKDLDSIYTTVRPFAISYAIGYFIGGMISVVLFLAIFFGWRPFKKYDQEQHGNYVPYACPGMEVYREGKRVTSQDNQDSK